MTPNQQQLLSLLRNRAFIEGEVTLASGATSDFYIDGRMVATAPKGARLIGEVLYELTEDLEFDAVGGLAVGAVPIVTSLVISCDAHGKPVEGFWVRPAVKDHGQQKQIEGRLPEGARVVIVDDVITSGGSTFKAIHAAEEAGCTVVAVLAVVDRAAGAAEKFAEAGYHYQPAFTKQDFFAKA